MENPGYVRTPLHLKSQQQKINDISSIIISFMHILKQSTIEMCFRCVPNVLLITHKVHPILCQPVEALEEEQEGEEGHEARGEIISEHSEGQTRLCDSVPGALDEMLQDGPQVHINIKTIRFSSKATICGRHF